MQIVHFPIFPESPTNPARVDVRTGVVEINDARWKQLSEEEKAFVLLHERGHYQGQTFDEVKADQYALSQLALKKPYSLRNYLYAVNNISYGNTRRVNQAKYDVLRIAADNGSKEAQKLLDRYSIASADGGKTFEVNPAIWITAMVIVLLAVICLLKKK